eukprot:Awhi_evm1s1770
MNVLLLLGAVSAMIGFVMVIKPGVVSFPEKWVWIVFFATILADLGCNALYDQGGYFMALYPVLFWTPVVYKTTGSIALAIALYSRANDMSISAHWYSIPTGCTFLSQLSAYIPAYYVQSVAIILVAGYIQFFKKPLFNDTLLRLVTYSLGLVVISVAQDYFSVQPFYQKGELDFARGMLSLALGLTLSNSQKLKKK